jgi:uncharacterized ferredoxin-like protein
MKLYATTTSERASKGQGGNQFLTIEIQAEGWTGIPTRTNLYRLSISKADENGGLYAEIMKYSNHEIIVLDNIKGNKQKGENCYICGKSAKYATHTDKNGDKTPLARFTCEEHHYND